MAAYPARSTDFVISTSLSRKSDGQYIFRKNPVPDKIPPAAMADAASVSR